ncbi:hypothetical protein [Gordonia sp. 'Campus']|uniref:hypothetical protein n=1 Tax=Gordonia sp. 'Campus' TaxID=2915824 RepID=UPI001EE4AAAE|nr:hypothetical protein [Gordonia sp. 'Campus']
MVTCPPLPSLFDAVLLGDVLLGDILLDDILLDDIAVREPMFDDDAVLCSCRTVRRQPGFVSA